MGGLVDAFGQSGDLSTEQRIAAFFAGPGLGKVLTDQSKKAKKAEDAALEQVTKELSSDPNKLPEGSPYKGEWAASLGVASHADRNASAYAPTLTDAMVSGAAKAQLLGARKTSRRQTFLTPEASQMLGGAQNG